MAPITYTPLERFLFLRAIQNDDHSSLTTLDHAAASLREDPILRESGFSDPSKLQPEPLRDLYFGLIKEEVKLEQAGRDGSPLGEDNTRKRNIGSPKLESLGDASNYTNLLPSLLDRLYIQYRDDAIKLIEDEERQFRSLQKEIQALELHTNEARAARPGSQGVPPISALLRETEESAQPPRPVEQALNGASDSIHPPTGNLHADIYKPLSQPDPVENGPPYFPPPPAPSAQPYPLHASNIDRRSSNQAPHPSASPRSNQAPLPPPERSSASPIILPPPKGMVRSSGSPPVPSPQQTHYPPPRQPSTQHATPRPQSYYYDNQGPYPPPYSSYGQPPGPIYHPHGGHMQPYMPQVHSPHAGHYPSQTYQSPAASHHPAYYNSRQYPPNTPQTPYTQVPSQYHDRNAPVQSTPTAQQSARASPLVTTTSSTKWKKYELPAGAPQPTSPIRPHSRDISPISIADSVENEPDEGTGKEEAHDAASPLRNRNLRQQRRASDHEQTPNRGRGGRKIGTKRGRHARTGSVISSGAGGSGRRSQSIADDASAVKAEHSHAAHDSASDSSSSSDEASRKATRRRRGTIRNKEADHSHLKRKREDGLRGATARTESITRGSPAASFPQPRRAPRRPGYILATRNFSRITSPLINQITTHRLGSLFAKPLSEKDAPGYKDRIFRPQDLKSLKAAISSGGRTLNAMIEEAGDSAGTGAHMWVPASDELKPPKGIVNAWQLDKELARIFANAVMYNPDISANRGLGNGFWERWEAIKDDRGMNANSSDDGKFEIGVAAPMDGDFVRDTRIVAKDAQEYFAEWRQVEQEDGETIPVLGKIEDEHEDEEPKDAPEHLDTEEGSERRSKRRKR